MEANQFILALSKTLPQSCVQGLTIYLLLQLLFWVDKRSMPRLKFNLYYAANWLLFVSFLVTFFHHFQQVLPNRFTIDLASSASTKHILNTSIKPDLGLSARFWLQHYTYLLTGFYLLGLLFFLLKFAVSIFKVEQFRQPKNLKLDNKLSQTCIQLSNNFKLLKTVSVYVSAKIMVPLTIGFIKPIIVFPVALINQLSAEQTEAILLHELAHIKRNDYLLNLLLCVVQAFLFFNPAIWLMQCEINKYREQSCDDLVLDQTQNQLAYAHALLLIEQYRSQSLNLTLASNGKKYTLLNRVKRITNQEKTDPSPQNKLIVLLLALITVGVCIACNHTEKKAAKPYKSKRLSFTVYNTKSTGFNPARPYAEWSTDTTKFIRKSEHDSLKVYTNKITYKPNKKYSKRYVFSGNNMILNGFSDTAIHSKTKYKITVEDSSGNKKEYNSIDELPEADRKEFLKENKQTTHVESWDNFKSKNDTTQLAFNFSGLKENMAVILEQMRKKFDTPEWRKKFENLNKQGLEIQEKMRKKFDTPEWRKNFENLNKQSSEIQEKMVKKIDTSKFENNNLHVQVGINYKLKDEILKYYQSPEWKKQQKKIKKEVEKSQRQWRKSYDQTLKPTLPEKPITPQF